MDHGATTCINVRLPRTLAAPHSSPLCHPLTENPTGSIVQVQWRPYLPGDHLQRPLRFPSDSCKQLLNRSNTPSTRQSKSTKTIALLALADPCNRRQIRKQRRLHAGHLRRRLRYPGRRHAIHPRLQHQQSLRSQSLPHRRFDQRPAGARPDILFLEHCPRGRWLRG